MTKPLRSADLMAMSVLSDSGKMNNLATNPEKVLHDAANEATSMTPAYFGDVWIYRIVVGGLSLAILLVLAAYVALAETGKPLPDALIAIGSGAIGALTGLLAPSPSQKS
jgi:hypothetical protein